jgi:hypothetical protein
MLFVAFPTSQAGLYHCEEAGRLIEAEIGPQQDWLEGRLLGMGARNIVRIRALNMLTIVAWNRERSWS